jgi:hypothetical protein
LITWWLLAVADQLFDTAAAVLALAVICLQQATRSRPERVIPQQWALAAQQVTTTGHPMRLAQANKAPVHR